MPIRAMTPADLDRVHAINEASVPDVESLSPEQVSDLLRSSEMALVASLEDDIVGFGFVVGRSAPSEVPRTTWALGRDDIDLHLERIGFERTASGFGLGATFYDWLDAFAAARAVAAGKPVRLSSFVTVEPLLQHSFDFHRKRGFVEIDRLTLEQTTVALVQKVYPA